MRTFWATKYESRSESKLWLTCHCLYCLSGVCLKAMKLSAKTHFKARKAYLCVDIYILCQNGTIKFDDDEIEMKTGSMKLFLKVHNHYSLIYHVISVTRHYNHVGGALPSF